MGKLISILLCVLIVGLIERSEGRNAYEEEPGYNLEKVNGDDVNQGPVPNKICNCDNDFEGCSCCIREFRKTVCTALTLVEVKCTGEVLLQLNMTVNDRLVLFHQFSTEKIPPLCYKYKAFGACVELSVKKEQNYRVCASLALEFEGRDLVKEELYCLKVQAKHLGKLGHQKKIIKNTKKLILT